MIKNCFLLGFVLLLSLPLSAKSIHLVMMGFQMNISDDSIRHEIIYKLINTSQDTIYFAPRCIVHNNLSTNTLITAGGFGDLLYVDHEAVVLRKLSPNDSFTIKSTFEKPILKNIVISFDCLMLSKLSSKKKTLFYKSRSEFQNAPDSWIIDHFIYESIYTDWFKINLFE